jgi:queuine tRNA-ribosyltransferase
MTAFGFDLIGTDGGARRGRVTTAHGSIETPAFMPVGTAATVKAMFPWSVEETGAEIILGNTYHLMLRPGAERMERLGGLHEFMKWDRPILTDSGGYQVMSLAQLRKITEKGVTFRSHVDGQAYELTPERSIDIQRMLDSDITMAFDECTPYPATEKVASESMQLSMRWAQRSRDAFTEREGYGIFGIVQGSVYKDLREESVKALTGIDFHGYAVGGLAVGEGQELMFSTLDFTTPMMLADKPRYLMGVGKPDDLVGAVARGIDMFDCVLPTRSGRNGQIFTWRGTVNLRNARHAEDHRPLDESCGCPACRNFSRAYMHHLVKTGEMLGPMLASWHNIHFYQDLMAAMRAAIAEGRFEAFRKEFAERYGAGDIDPL